jgi:hypothetical protein
MKLQWQLMLPWVGAEQRAQPATAEDPAGARSVRRVLAAPAGPKVGAACAAAAQQGATRVAEVRGAGPAAHHVVVACIGEGGGVGWGGGQEGRRIDLEQQRGRGCAMHVAQASTYFGCDV